MGPEPKAENHQQTMSNRLRGRKANKSLPKPVPELTTPVRNTCQEWHLGAHYRAKNESAGDGNVNGRGNAHEDINEPDATS